MSDEFLTVDGFKRSFSYGSRNDLAFKFLKNLSDADVADFFQELLVRLGDAADTGDVMPLVEHYIRSQQAGYLPRGERTWVYDDGPFAYLPQPLAEATVGLIASSGHFVEGDDPAPFGVDGMTQDEAIERISDFMREAPGLSAIPIDTSANSLSVRHGGYDVRGASRDHEVALPLRTLCGMADDGVIDSVADPAFSFVGAASQGRLRNESLPEWSELIGETGSDALLLVPL